MSSLPVISSLEQLLPALKLWQQTLNPSVNVPPQPRIPFNFRSSSGIGTPHTTLQWESVQGADGYQIQSSSNGDFSTPTTATIIAALRGQTSTSWTDALSASGVKRWYRIRATAGTVNQPQVIFGVYSAPIIATSGSGAIVYDKVSSTPLWNNRHFPAIGPKLSTA